MQTQQQFKKWKLILDHTIRAHSIILPAELEEDEVLDHIMYTHKNVHRWPESTDEREIDVKLSYEYVKPIYVSDAKRNQVIAPAPKKEEKTTCYKYEYISITKNKK